MFVIFILELLYWRPRLAIKLELEIERVPRVSKQIS